MVEISKLNRKVRIKGLAMLSVGDVTDYCTFKH